LFAPQVQRDALLATRRHLLARLEPVTLLLGCARPAELLVPDGLRLIAHTFFGQPMAPLVAQDRADLGHAQEHNHSCLVDGQPRRLAQRVAPVGQLRRAQQAKEQTQFVFGQVKERIAAQPP
jgi:hypothetical protein